MKTLSIGELLRSSWDITKKNYLLILGLVIISMAFGWLGELAPESALWQIVVTVLSIFVSVGITRITLNIVDGKPAGLNQLFSESSKFWNYLFASILYGVLVIVGLFILIIPGIYFAIKYAFATYAVVDENLNAIDAFKRSAEITRGAGWNIFGYAIVIILLNIIGALPLLLGLFITVPLSFISGGVIYRTLQKQTGKATKEKAEVATA